MTKRRARGRWKRGAISATQLDDSISVFRGIRNSPHCRSGSNHRCLIYTAPLAMATHLTAPWPARRAMMPGAELETDTEACRACAQRENAQRIRMARRQQPQQQPLGAASVESDGNSSGYSSIAPTALPSPSQLEAEEEALQSEEEDEMHPHSHACTYTSSLPIDPLSHFSRVLLPPVHTGVLSVSFSGCGGFYPYLYGVACYLQDHYDLRDVHFLGTSGGCLPALTLATGLDVRESFFERWNNLVIAEAGRSLLQGYFSFISTCHKFAHEYFDERIHLRANGRLHLSTTRVLPHVDEPEEATADGKRGWGIWNAGRTIWHAVRALPSLFSHSGGSSGSVHPADSTPSSAAAPAAAPTPKLLQNERVSHWHSKSDLIDCVAASTYIPILDRQGLFKHWRGRRYLDGGLTDNQPCLDADTIKLEPFMFRNPGIVQKASFIYIRLSPLWHAEQFARGYEDAREHGAKIFARLPRREQPDCRPVLPLEMQQQLKQATQAQAASDASVAKDGEWRAMVM